MLRETLEYIGIAFVSSALLIVLSKIILQSLIRRPADYYAAEELRQEELMLNAGGLSMFAEHETTPEGDTIERSHLKPQIPWYEEPEEIEETTTKTRHDKKVAMQHTEDDSSEHVWLESYDDIRKSLEAAFAEKSVNNQHIEEPAAEPLITASAELAEEPAAEPLAAPVELAEEPAEASLAETAPGIHASLPEEAATAGKPNIPVTKTGKPRKPSMKMKKDELAVIASSMGIEIPPKATKAVILELINEQKQSEQESKE